MYHLHFKGTHYEIGYRFGNALKKRNMLIRNNVPFEITHERIDFAEACKPIYQKYFPEISEEINGIADGQECTASIIKAILFGMYALPPSCNCSCFAFSDKNNVLLCRNSDFLPSLKKLNMNFIYNFSRSDCYSFTGNTTSFTEAEDGINEHGLAVGLTSVYPKSVKPGFNAGMLTRFFLEKCKSTDEVIEKIKVLPISSSQTITAADKCGNIAVIECNSEKINVIRPSYSHPFVCATNIFHSEEMASFNNFEINNFMSEERYQTMENALKTSLNPPCLISAKDILSGKKGFLCQYKSCEIDTVWSVIYDIKEKKIYRAEGNPRRRKFIKDERFAFI